MKITILKEIGIALPQKEGPETLVQNKIVVRVLDTEGNDLAVKCQMCGKIFEKSLSADAVEEGTHQLIVTYEGKRYIAARVTRTGEKLIVIGHDYKIILKASIAAEKALGIAKMLNKRVEALEKAYNGVDLLNLS